MMCVFASGSGHIHLREIIKALMNSAEERLIICDCMCASMLFVHGVGLFPDRLLNKVL